MDNIPKMSFGAVFDQLRRLCAFSWRTTLAVLLLFLTVMFVYYVSLQWLPTFLMEAGFEQTQAFLTTGGMSAIGLVGALLATFLVEKTGRKPLLAVSAVLGSILLVILAVFLHVPPAVLPLVLIYGLVIQVAIPVMYAFASGLYPTDLRTSGFGWASAVSRISSGIGPLLFITHLVPALTLPGAFGLAAGLVILAVGPMFLLAPETTGNDLQD